MASRDTSVGLENGDVARRVVIIMPAHNEAENLPQVFAELRSHVPGVDVVVIDDYSSDDTASVARAWGAHVVSLPCNLGYGGAIQTGFKYAVERGYDYAVMLDADGQHDPLYIPALLQPVLRAEADVAIGSRFLGSMTYNAGWLKRTGMAVFAAIATRFTRRRVTDPTSGYQAMNRRVLCFFARENYPSDYPDADTLLTLYYSGFRVQEVPVRIRERLAGVSMHSSWKVIYYIFKMLLSILMILVRHKTRQRAVCFADPRGATPCSQGPRDELSDAQCALD
ncbi:MAG: glycosyltransferase family 2 protein [Anaerolineae bacterium]|nr:glycosyltransferase family 2 protein [Anaerolineae bacterium]